MSFAFIAPALPPLRLSAAPFTRSVHSVPSLPPPNRRVRPTLSLTPPLPSPDDPLPSPDSPPPSPVRPPSSDLCFSTAASSAPTLNAALTDAAARALANISPGGPPTLALVFVSARYCVPQIGPSGRDSLSSVVPKLRALVPELRAVLGCTADGVIGTGPTMETVEVEDVPGISLTLARLPGISFKTFHVMPDDLPSLDARQVAWRDVVGRPEVGTGGAPVPSFIVLSDPAFAERGELDRFLSGVEFAYPGSCVVGSLASAAAALPQGHLLCTLPRDVLSPQSSSLRDSGVVGISLVGDVQMDCLVSEACRAIGPVFEVRRVGSGNVLLEMELVGRPSSSLSAVGHLKSLVSYATPQEKRLMQSELFVGVLVEGIEGEGERYVIRHVIGLDMNGGGIAVGQRIRAGQRVKFFVKERESAEANLDATMQKYKRVELANNLVGYSNPPFGAMAFVDAGRGRSLFREPMMETRNLSSFAPGVPVVGFFGGGQIGPCKTGEDGMSAPSVLHSAANLIALVRRRSGLSPVEPVDSPSTSAVDLDDNSERSG